MAVPQRALAGEPGLLVGAAGTRVVRVDVELDALQALLAEAEVTDREQRLGAIALAPLLLLADGDAEGRRTILQVQIAQVS